MLKMNKKMRQIIKKERGMDDKIVYEICKDIVSKTKRVNDCILYDEYGDLETQKINWEFVIEKNKDLTGYEICQNEISIPDKLFNQSLLNFMEYIKDMMRIEFPGERFCVILTYADNPVLRFHLYRPQDEMWLSEEIEKYSEPVLFEIF